MTLIIGQCAKHPGQNTVNCPFCQIENASFPSLKKVLTEEEKKEQREKYEKLMKALKRSKEQKS